MYITRSMCARASGAVATPLFDKRNMHSCGGVFTAPSGEIHSPNYPNPYSVNVDCSWIINVDQGHRVLLTFNDFDIENHDSCGYDYLAVSNSING
ncbi:UNVERIFIED_CONTAM: hypothetical protein FKN15_029245 [Acipenser sinensis]